LSGPQKEIARNIHPPHPLFLKERKKKTIFTTIFLDVYVARFNHILLSIDSSSFITIKIFRTNSDLQNITHKAKDQATRTPLKTRG